LSRRLHLASAILNHREAIAVREAAWRAADRAWDMKKEADTHLKSFHGLDDRITGYRADKIKAWSTGEGDGSATSRDLSPDLAEAVSARDLAIADAASAAAVHKALKADAEATDAGVRQAEAALTEAAQGVMAQTAAEVAVELGNVQALTDALRFRLRACVAVLTSGPLKVTLGSGIVELAKFPREPYLIPGNNPEQREIDNLLSYHRRLLTDPDSVLDQSSS
jgi:hypothetical protein